MENTTEKYLMQKTPTIFKLQECTLADIIDYFTGIDICSNAACVPPSNFRGKSGQPKHVEQ